MGFFKLFSFFFEIKLGSRAQTNVIVAYINKETRQGRHQRSMNEDDASERKHVFTPLEIRECRICLEGEDVKLFDIERQNRLHLVFVEVLKLLFTIAVLRGGASQDITTPFFNVRLVNTNIVFTDNDILLQ